MSIAFAQGAVALRSAGTGTGSVRLSAANILYRFGRFLQYSGSHVNPAVVTLQRAARNRLYRKLVPLGSGTRRADLEQTHGFMRTLILGKSVENRNFYAMRELRTSGRARQTYIYTFNMLTQYACRVPKISDIGRGVVVSSSGSGPLAGPASRSWTRQLNGAFKVKFICESWAKCPTTSWNVKTGRWSSAFETADAIEKIKTNLELCEKYLTTISAMHRRPFMIFHDYIRALKCINHDSAYHSSAQEGILAPFIDDIEYQYYL